MKGLFNKVRSGFSSSMSDSGNKGFSLVEVICAVAIFAVIAATVSGVLVFCAKSYQRGSTESEIQQEAQFAANRISGIIQNATEVQFSAPALEMKKGNVVYKISLNEGDQSLEYQEIVTAADGTETVGDVQVLAGNIKDFKANVSEFEKAHTVILDLTVAKSDKEYLVRYTMNARNEEIAVSTSALPPSASIHVSDSSLILVPGESYTVKVDVRGSDKPFDVSGSEGIAVSKMADSITVTVNSDNRNNSAFAKVFVKNDDGTELCSKLIQIDIRCVTGVNLRKNQNAESREYTIYADVEGWNFAKIVGGSNEENYKNPCMVEWSGQLLVCSSTAGEFDTEVANFKVERVGDENKIVFENEEEVKKYISLDDTYLVYSNINDEEKKISSKSPAEFRVKLTDSFDSNTKLVVKAESKHAAGINKASHVYGSYSGEIEITVPKLKPTKVLMVPGQTYTLNGVRVVNPECSVYIGGTEITNPADAGIIPVFEPENSKLSITLNEKAKGDNHGVITLYIHSQGSTVTQLIVEVYVRRVNPQPQSGEVRKGNLKIDYQLMEGEGKSVNGEWGIGAEYQFKSRINGTNLFFNNSAEFINADTEDQYKQYNPFAVEFSWVLKIAGAEQAETKGGAVVTYYECGAENSSVGATAVSTTGSQSNSYFNINSFALNKESPAVNIITRKAFQSNWELVVTARALHPNMDGTKGRNKYNYIYTEAADKFIEGSYTLKKEGGRQNLADFGFKRADRFNYTLPGFESGKIPALKAGYFNYGDFQQYTFYRYKEVVTAANDINSGVISEGTWSKYYKTDDNQYTWAYMTGGRMARLFRSDKEYYIDVVNVLYNTNEKKIYWPQDPSLLEAGAGWAEAGYTLKNWTCTFSAADKSFESKQEFYIPRTEMWVGPHKDARYKTLDPAVSTYGQLGSEAAPIKIKGGRIGGGQMGEEFAVIMEPTAFDLPAAYWNFTAVLEKKTSSGWVQVQTGGSMQNNEHWNLRTQNPEIMAEATWGARGLYRISSVINNMDWTDVSGDMFNPTYTTTYETLPLYEDNGAGIIYIEFTD